MRNWSLGKSVDEKSVDEKSVDEKSVDDLSRRYPRGYLATLPYSRSNQLLA